jgi:cytochrome P450
MDVVSDLSVVLPRLIAEIFGVPETDRANLIKWAIDMTTFGSAPGSSNIEEFEGRPRICTVFRTHQAIDSRTATATWNRHD